MGDPVEVRPLSSLDDVRSAAALFDRIWQERRVMGAPLLRAMAAHGGQVLGARDGDELWVINVNELARLRELVLLLPKAGSQLYEWSEPPMLAAQLG